MMNVRSFREKQQKQLVHTSVEDPVDFQSSVKPRANPGGRQDLSKLSKLSKDELISNFTQFLITHYRHN